MSKKIIDKQIKKMAVEIADLNLAWSKEISNSIFKSAIAGKGVRGSLVLMTLELFNRPISGEAIKTAAAIEYLHTALLIQDDIMDHDEWRRGRETMHIEYQKKGKKLKVFDREDFGKSMAICIADVAIFSALWSLSRLDKLDYRVKNDLLKLISKEFLLVGFGQIQDLVFAHTEKSPSVKKVLEMYKYKTARYTFSLPLMLGAILAKKDQKIINDLDKIGIALGLIFQLTDDALTLNGEIDKVGKAIGNDIAENKKTLYHVLLRKKANQADLRIINSIFGKKRVNKKDIEIIRDLISNYQIDKNINQRIASYKKGAEKIINNLKIKKTAKKRLYSLIDYLIKRKK